MDMLSKAIVSLGSRHIKYHSGERREYIIVGECFMFTLNNMVNEKAKMTDDVQEAWFRICILFFFHYLYMRTHTRIHAHVHTRNLYTHAHLVLFYCCLVLLLVDFQKIIMWQI